MGSGSGLVRRIWDVFFQPGQVESRLHSNNVARKNVPVVGKVDKYWKGVVVLG